MNDSYLRTSMSVSILQAVRTGSASVCLSLHLYCSWSVILVSVSYQRPCRGWRACRPPPVRGYVLPAHHGCQRRPAVPPSRGKQLKSLGIWRQGSCHDLATCLYPGSCLSATIIINIIYTFQADASLVKTETACSLIQYFITFVLPVNLPSSCRPLALVL
jgi:hypothetical protein